MNTSRVTQLLALRALRALIEKKRPFCLGPVAARWRHIGNADFYLVTLDDSYMYLHVAGTWFVNQYHKYTAPYYLPDHANKRFLSPQEMRDAVDPTTELGNVIQLLAATH